MAALFAKTPIDPYNNLYQYCGGSLIAPGFVLTAGVAGSCEGRAGQGSCSGELPTADMTCSHIPNAPRVLSPRCAACCPAAAHCTYWPNGLDRQPAYVRVGMVDATDASVPTRGVAVSQFTHLNSSAAQWALLCVHALEYLHLSWLIHKCAQTRSQEFLSCHNPSSPACRK